MQSLISARSHEGVQGTKWVEFVQDLWTEEKLKHLRDVAMPYGYDDHLFQFDPATQLYGFQEGTDVEEESFLFIHTDYPSSLQEASQSLVDSAEETSQPVKSGMFLSSFPDSTPQLFTDLIPRLHPSAFY